MEEKKHKRILWLLNQSFPGEFEVPLLERLGFEVYVPEVNSSSNPDLSTSIASRANKNLTIAQSFFHTLNRFDLFTKPWPRSLAEKINENFGIVFAPDNQGLLEEIIKSFNGLLFLRVFGLQGEATYAEQFRKNLSEKTFTKLKHANNIWLAAGYDILIDNEPHWLRRKCIHLPHGIKQVNHKKYKWNGSSDQALFFCPDFLAKNINNKVCKEIRDSFAELPHVIMEDDSQSIDPLKREEYLNLLRTSKVLYYPAADTRHLHTYVMDALACGLPVIFRADNLLEYLAKQKLPGCCGSFEEAREKIVSILDGDQSLIKEIQSSQEVLLKAFHPEYVEKYWRAKFMPFVKEYFQRSTSQEKALSKNSQSHVGIWMHVHIPGCLTGEGISNLIAMIIRGAQKNEEQDIKIHIAAVSWIKEDIIEFLVDEGIDTDKIEFILVGHNPPFVYRIYHWWINRKPRIRREKLFWQDFERMLEDLIVDTGSRLLTVRTVPGLIFLILALLLFSPVIIVMAGFYLLVMIVDKLLNWIKDQFTNLSPVRKGIDYIQRVRRKFVEIVPTVYQRMLDSEFSQLAEKVGGDERFKAWFFAYPNNKYIDHFISPCVVAVPDLVYLDFPSLYSKAPFRLINHPDNHISLTIRNADTVITFSNYIRENHVIKPGLQAAQNVHVIPHAPINKRDAITARKEISDYELQFIARQIIKKYINEAAMDRPDNLSTYLRDINLGEMDYIFVSSQTRPHKNHLNLIKAYQILLREKYINQKLVFTGRFYTEIEEYIKQERLHFDVLSFNLLPTKIHAAFYACANLSVVPTLFEGGFPFVFSESLSVRTPVILSDIPVVQEVLSAEERKKFCFNPYDIRAMVNKMGWALENHKILLEMELKTLEKMKARTWEDVAEDYLHLFLESNTQGRKYAAEFRRV